MSKLIAALPMYDWPETRDATDALWARLRHALRRRGIPAAERLARQNADLPPVPGGIRDAEGRLVAADPASLPPDELDLNALWMHPDLLLAQTCWGPMELGLREHVRVVGQPDYSAYEGGRGEFYSSAIVMREGAKAAPAADGASQIPLDLLRGKRLAFNSPDSMSGILALKHDLEAIGSGPEIFSDLVETGSHRASAQAVAEGRADAAAIDCRTWDLIRRHDRETAARLKVVGWTGQRPGLPLIASARLPETTISALRDVLSEAGLMAR